MHKRRPASSCCYKKENGARLFWCNKQCTFSKAEEEQVALIITLKHLQHLRLSISLKCIIGPLKNFVRFGQGIFSRDTESSHMSSGNFL